MTTDPGRHLPGGCLVGPTVAFERFGVAVLVLALSLVAIGLAGLTLRGAVAASTAVAALLAEVQRRRWQLTAPDLLQEVDPYELAQLGGDRWRTIDVAIAALHAGNQIRVSREGMVSAVNGQPAAATPLERAVFSMVAQAPNQRMHADELRRKASTGDLIEQLRQGMRERGMLLPGSIGAPVVRQLNMLRRLSTGSIVAGLTVLAALLAGPVWWLVGWLAGVAAAVGVLAGVHGLGRFRRDMGAMHSSAGHWHDSAWTGDVVATTAQQYRWSAYQAIAKQSPAERAALPAPLVAATLGLAALDPDLASALHPPAEDTDTTGNAGTGCGGCGGGCGGCGGCGCGG